MNNIINPMMMFQRMFGNNISNLNPMIQMMQQIMGNNNGQIPNLNQAQFKQFLPNISEDKLKQLAIQAKNQGMSEDEIVKGLNFMKGLMKSNSLKA